MARTTIDFGLYLGTSTCALALNTGAGVTFIRNQEGEIFTPAAVWIDPDGQEVTGRLAEEQAYADPQNAVTGFRLHMGTGKTFHFARSKRILTPQVLSAILLKSMKEDAYLATGETIQASVLTVPADFGPAQNNATREAAQMAGISQSPLLQEPVAAALAYDMPQRPSGTYWLAYELSAATFDVTILQVLDGQVQMMGHGWDNQIGGNLFDWAMVDALLAPTTAARYSLTDFRRENPAWGSAFARLKLAAREARRLLQQQDRAEVMIEFLCMDDDNSPVFDVEYTVRQTDLDQLLEAYIKRTVQICRSTLSRHSIDPARMERVIMIGEASLTRQVRRAFQDKQNGLGLPAEYSLDPATVIAYGAARFAGTQALKPEGRPLTIEDERPVYRARFPDWKLAGNEENPVVAGLIIPPKDAVREGLKLVIVNTTMRPEWQSDPINVLPNGMFMATLVAEEGPPNVYEVRLADADGKVLTTATSPARLTYSVGVSGTTPLMTKSVGIALPGDQVYWFVEKGTLLPAEKKVTLRTGIAGRAGQPGYLLDYPLIDGESPKASQNQIFGRLLLPAAMLAGPLPVNSEVDLMVTINQARMVYIRAYIPALDQEFQNIIVYGQEESGRYQQLKAETRQQLKRLNMLRQNLSGPRRLGLAWPNQEIDWFFDGRTTLPLDVDRTYHTTQNITPGMAVPVLRVMIVEEPVKSGARPPVIGKLEIRSDQINRQLQAGSAVAIRLHVDRGSRMWASATIPALEQSLNVLYLARRPQEEEQREQAREVLERVVALHIVEDLSRLVEEAARKPEKVDDAEQRLLDLRMGLDEIEDLVT